MALRQIDKFLKWNKAQNRYEPIMWRREVLPSWITFTENTPLPITVPATPALTPQLTIKQPYFSVEGADRGLGTPFELRSLLFQDSTNQAQASEFTVFLKEVGEVREFMNRPVHVRTMFGNAQYPALLREPYMLLSQHNIMVQLANLTATPANVRLYGAGAQYFPWAPELMRYKKDRDEITGVLKKWLNRRRYVTPFWLTSDVAITLGANASGNFSFKIGDDGHFEAFGHAVVSTGDFNFNLSEVKTKQTLMNGRVTKGNNCGDAKLPTIYPTPYLIPAGYRMNLNVTNLTGVSNSIFWTFFGRKIYAPFTQVEEVLNDTSVPTPGDTPTQIVPAPL